MTAKILDGNLVSRQIIAQLMPQVATLNSPPYLVIIQVLGDEASSIYVKHKLRIAATLGIRTQHITLKNDIKEDELFSTIRSVNEDFSVHGILLQLPLPAHLSTEKAIDLIHPSKDVDGLTALNLGRLMRKNPLLIPCTPLGIITLLKHYQLDLRGQQAVILNSSTLVGKPLALLLLQEGATPVLCNSQTKNRVELIHSADILISATGKAHYVESSWIKPGAIVVDVGVHRQDNTKKLVGDINFEEAKQIASWLTPVPGGIGPMTIAMLMQNVLRAYQLSK